MYAIPLYFLRTICKSYSVDGGTYKPSLVSSACLAYTRHRLTNPPVSERELILCTPCPSEFNREPPRRRASLKRYSLKLARKLARKSQSPSTLPIPAGSMMC
jgi:hypothetical protein